ncbi:DUF1998 domain-containing protein [Planctomonas psychrotolerans]|uniref:DUF1998 domain-containing protein n=1 Tax=Planctomonas psychrotolerans TaxID=2528712 RepID=UPI00123A6B57|nr:DUF1998 domain-containing protein [Planctomonas psychrotolerans]
MATSERPKARQSQLVSTYGIGSLFPAGDQSFMICGLDDWYTSDSLRVEEPRLARSLRVSGFYAPSTGRKTGDVPAVRFPAYQYCPQCRTLAPFWKFDSKRMVCAGCERDITPSRFVACCENGHIEEFPYFQWVHRGEAPAGGRHSLTLNSRGASSSLSDIVISCSCGVKSYSLEGSFARNALRTIRSCGGKRPWLPDSADETCDKPLRALQRGSSNVWFAEVRSTISIPPWSSPNSQFVTKNWTVLEHFPLENLSAALPAMISGKPGLDAAGILDTVRRRKALQSDSEPTEAELREEEYHALIAGHDGGRLDTFRCTEVDVDARLDGVLEQVSKVSRLREVRALHGFTRVTSSPTASVSPRSAKLSEQAPSWLPATEVLGEGIFVRLSEQFVAKWESTGLAASQVAKITESLCLRAAESDLPAPEGPAARFVAIHSFAHALLQELSLDAGYPVGSLRERVYAAPDQAGVLIYTASSDAAGSLGGLAALSKDEVLADTIIRALSRASWCTNDPVCAESGPSGSDGLNLAACHACLLLPETSCEYRNQYLDRVTIIGSISGEEEGLLSEILVSAET